MKKIFVLLFITFLLASCFEKNEVVYYRLNFIFTQKLENVKAGDFMPQPILDIIQFYNMNKSKEECKGTVFAPEKIFFKRIDTGKEYSFDTPLNLMKRMQKKAGTLSPLNLMEGYNLSSIKVPDILVMNNDSVINKIQIKKDYIVLKLNNSNKQGILNIRNQIEKALCEGAKEITILVNTKDNRDVVNIEEEGNIELSDNQETVATYKKEEGTQIEVDKETKVSKVTTTTVTKTNITNKSIDFNYARYEGTVVNGKMNGNGTLIFIQDHKAPIPDLSTVNIFVRKGQKISGTFNNDFLVSGKLLDKDGSIIRSIIVGNNR